MSERKINETYLIVSDKYPYQAYFVGEKDECEEKMRLKKYQEGFHIRKAIDSRDGYYRVETEYIGRRIKGYVQLRKVVDRLTKKWTPVKFMGTERDWFIMQLQPTIDISQSWSKELYKTEL